MKAKETYGYRPNNLVLGSNGVAKITMVKNNSNNETLIEAWYLHDPNICASKEYFLVPIELTEEWLIKFGFAENRPWTFNKGKKDEWTTTLDGYSTDAGSEGFRLEWCQGKLCFELYYHYEEIKTVHRLQNLYFALTEKELTIK